MTYAIEPANVPLGSTLHLQRKDGSVNSYVFDGTFRDLQTGKRYSAGRDLGEYQDRQVVAPEDTVTTTHGSRPSATTWRLLVSAISARKRPMN